MPSPDTIAAWFGSVTGLLSILWQVGTWRRSRHHVKVQTSNVYFEFAGAPLAHHVQITAVNVGRDPVHITNWGISINKRNNLAIFEHHVMSSKIPSTLGPNDYVDFYLAGDALSQVCREYSLQPRQLRAWVRLSTGSKAFARGSLKGEISL